MSKLLLGIAGRSYVEKVLHKGGAGDFGGPPKVASYIRDVRCAAAQQPTRLRGAGDGERIIIRINVVVVLQSDYLYVCPASATAVLKIYIAKPFSFGPNISYPHP